MADSADGGVAGQIREFLKESSVYGIGLAVSKAASFIILPLVTAKLTAADLGVLTLLQVMGAVVMIVLNSGVQQAINRNYYDENTAEHRAAVVGTGLLWRLALTVIVVGALALSAPLSTRLMLGESSRTYVVYFLFSIANIAVMSPQGIAYTLYRVRRQPVLNMSFSIAGVVVSTALVALLLWAIPRGIRGVLEASLVANAVITIAMLPDLLRSARLRFRMDVFRGIVSYGLPFLPHHLAVYLLFGVDRYFIEHYIGLTEVGLYSYAYRVAMILTLVLEGASMAWTPFLFSIQARADALRIHALSARYVIATIIGAAAFVVVFGTELVRLLAFRGPEYWSAASLVPLIVAGYVFLGMYQVFSAAVGIPKKTRLLPQFSGTGLVANLVLNWVLVPRHGSQGAAIATVISYACMGILAAVMTHRVYPVPYEWRRIAVLVLVGVAVTIAGSLVSVEPLAPRVAIKLLVLAGYPGLLYVFGFFNERERQAIAGVLNRVRRDKD